MELKIYAVLFGMTIVTCLPRILPLVLLAKMDIPPLLLTWLKYVPAAVLAALLAPEILIIDNTLSFSSTNPYFLAALPCFLIGFLTKNLFYTVFVGMAAMVLVNMGL